MSTITTVNPADRVAGPCLIRFKGRTIFSQGDVNIDAQLETFDVESSSYDPDPREGSLTFGIRFTPVGVLDTLDMFYYTGNIVSQRLIHHVRRFLPAAVTTGTDVIAIPNHGFRDKHGVVFTTDGTLPGGLTKNALVFLHKIDDDSFTAHATEADAAAATNPINLTTQGTGVHKVIEMEYLEIHSLTDDQEKRRYHNVGIVGIPSFRGNPKATAFGEATFEAFRKFGVAHNAANAFFTDSLEENTEAADLDLDDAPTQAVKLQWGAVAPFDDFRVADGVEMGVALNLRAMPDGAGGVASRIIDGQTITLQAAPLNISGLALYNKRVLQGAGTGTGRRLAAGADALNVIGDTIYARLYGAILTTSPLVYGKTAERVGALTWQATRNFTGGVVNPLYYVGAAAPV